jgi:NADP-dependent 3-hydroxy acid dehydrogenase YdfG
VSKEQTSVALAGRTVLVTGGSRGIGQAIGRRLCQQQARVLLVARNEGTLAEAARALGADWYAADVTEPAAVERLCKEAGTRWSAAPDVVVHSAGAFALAPIAETTVDAFDQQIAVNLRAVFLLTRALLPGMLARGSGHIVTIGSIAGRQAFPANGAYSASKFGVRGLHEVLQTELRGTGVRASLIEPAATDTELWDPIDRRRFPELPARAAMLNVDQVAEAVLYALSRPAGVVVPNLSIERG